jgi:hypothetical protein
VRWQPLAVAAGFAAPPILLAAMVWPEPSPAGGASTNDVEAELEVGDTDRSATNGLSSVDYLVRGDGIVRIDVDGPAFDPTLTLVDAESGEQLDYNDDTNGLNPSLVVELDEGEEVRVQVRSLGGPPGGAFTIEVVEADASDAVGAGADGDGGILATIPPEVAPTTVVAPAPAP